MFMQRIRRLHGFEVVTATKALPIPAFPIFSQSPQAVVHCQAETRWSGCVRLLFPSFLRTRHHES